MTDGDFYRILGVKRDATQDEIRGAYRRLARKYHPDVSDSPDAQTKFTEIQEAYDVLSDDKKRRLYDAGGFTATDGGPRQPGYTWSNVGGGQGVGFDFDMDDMGSMFESFFGGGSTQSGGAPGRAGGGRSSRSRPRRRGRNVEHAVTVPFLRAIEGGVERVRIARGGQSETIEVKVPAGIADGAKLRVAGKGEQGAGNAPAGDLILAVTVGSHPLYRRESSAPLDLHLNLPLTVEEAMLGATIPLPRPRWEVKLTVPPGTSGGATLRVRGRGVSSGSESGDLLIHIRVVLPDNAESEIQEASRAIGAVTKPPRTGPEWA